MNGWKPRQAALVCGSLVLSICLPACRLTSPETKHTPDPHSYARPWEVAIEHLHLSLAVDFAKQQIAGRATLDLVRHGDADELWLDTRDLQIRSVSLGPDEVPTPYRIGDEQPHLGQPLVIALQPETTQVHVDYVTMPTAAAIQWLTPEQTATGQSPFLFTQSQAILARTWIPCQDTPGVRFTYSADITVPPGLLALMSAENPTKTNATGIYEFQMQQPIPSYLLALAVGDLRFQSLGPRSGVYAEPPVLAEAAYEFADTEAMIESAEALYGAYRWDRYDILVLPPSFPFGGMENPRLTFATPTILAGDRSLVALIAHELAHSWSGNLVTNANWNDFWLNEGFTVYFEQRIMEAVYGRGLSEMLAQLTLDSLRSELQDLKSRDTWLHLDLAGRDPDDGMTGVAYDKGYFFLRMLEEHFGRDRFDDFLRRYFDRFAFQSMTAERFLEVLEQELTIDQATAADLQLHDWVYGPGLPTNLPPVHSEQLVTVEQQVSAFLTGAAVANLDVEGWTTHHWLHFLRALPEVLSTEQMAALDQAFGFTQTGNSEILHDWCLLAIRSQYTPAVPALQEFLAGQGRRKFLEPLYEALAETPEGLMLARQIYRDARAGYHSVAQSTIDRILLPKTP